MAHHTFSVPMTRDQAEQLRARGAEEGIVVEGDSGTLERGTPVGHIKVGFEFANDELKVTVLEKPVFISGGLIEGKVREELGKFFSTEA